MVYTRIYILAGGAESARSNSIKYLMMILT